jgi:hypothetical protein
MNLKIAIGLPVLFIVISAIAKKLGRGPGWLPEEDFAFGTELSIATLTAVLIEITDLINKTQTINDAVKDLIMNYVGYTVLMMAVFMAQIVIVQEQKNNRWDPRMRKWILLGFSNALGLGLLVFFFLKVRSEHST